MFTSRRHPYVTQPFWMCGAWMRMSGNVKRSHRCRFVRARSRAINIAPRVCWFEEWASPSALIEPNFRLGPGGAQASGRRDQKFRAFTYPSRHGTVNHVKLLPSTMVEITRQCASRCQGAGRSRITPPCPIAVTFKSGRRSIAVRVDRVPVCSATHDVPPSSVRRITPPSQAA